ncbi:MAG: hypothetical protein CVU91_04200 [Firmicutes bacterium HGW-Firmicutes-16]|nr:MAG: hypothetical protein CVU91_04200 [Firmicutes bacterium HGW-Firmicutes-16]
MKKGIISVVLSVMLLISMAVPVMAEDSQDAALKQVTLLVKNTLGIDNSYTDFNGNLSTEGSFSYWNLDWSKDGESVSVCADMNGKVISYYKSTDGDTYYYNPYYSPTFQKVSRDQAQSAAKAFVEKLLSQGETISFSKDNSRLSAQNMEYYQFNGTINLSGLKSPLTFSVNVHTSDLSITSFSRDEFSRSYTGSIPSETPVITTDKATAALTGIVKLRLQYVLGDDGKTATLQYLPVYSTDKAVDANTGALIDIYQGGYHPYPTYGRSENSTEDLAKNETGLTEVEQSTVDTLKGVYSKAQLDTIVRAIGSLGIDSAYTLDSAHYSTDKTTSAVQCALDYVKDISDEATIQARFPTAYSSMKSSGSIYPVHFGKTINLDAKTCALISMNTYYSVGKETVSQTNDQCKATAESFLGKYFLDKFKASAFNEYESSADKGYFVYSQTANGILFPTNSISVSVNMYDGTIDNFFANWTDGVTFASKDGIVTADAAITPYISCFKTVLQYVPVAVDTSKTDTSKYRNDSKLALAFKFESDRYVTGVDAKSGKVLTETGSPAQTSAYDDIGSCSAKQQIEKLAQYGIGFTGTSFKPTAPLTQKDALTLLLSAVGYSTDDDDSLYQMAYNNKMLTKAERAADKQIARAEFVKMLVRATEYGSAAKLDGIYKCGFKDDSSITKDYYGYVAIAKALGIVSGDSKNKFYPTSVITRQDTAVMLYNFMSRAQ